MRHVFLLILFYISASFCSHAQTSSPTPEQRTEIERLITNYSKARENRDTLFLKQILTAEVDQLVSTGEWRQGLNAAVQGMLKSSAEAPGTRVLTVDKIRMLQRKNAIVDCRYTVQNPDSTQRKMWSTFIVIAEKGFWKIAAIRNMLPSQP